MTDPTTPASTPSEAPEAMHQQPVPAALPFDEGVVAELDPVAQRPPPEVEREIDLRGRTLREHTGHGTVVNTAYMIGLSVLALVRGFILAAFLTRADYGVWGILAVSLGTLLWLKQVGIGDKFIQQDEEDQEAAFQKAFTLEFVSTAIFMVILAALVPVYAAAYGQWKLVAPGMVIVMLLPAGALQAPIWIYYRKMNFVRQRAFQSIEPIVSFVVCIVLAILGFGYWALAGGVLAGSYTAALVVVLTSPYKLRFRYEKATMRSYFSFSWPLFVGNGSSLVIAQSAVFGAEAKLGLAGVGAIALSSQIVSFTQRVDSLVTGTLYPAICAVKHRLKLLEETFVKSNRLALMWALPFGTSIALFCGDLVHFVLGQKWAPAVAILQITGFTAAFGHIAFNWDAYMRATSRTRPIAVASVASMVTFVALGLPLLFKYGLKGLAIGIALQTVANVICRAYYLRQLFDGFSYLRHALRAVLPSVPALALILIARELESGPRTPTMAVAELAGYLGVTIVATWLLERPLLREAAGYILSRRRVQTATG
jgi:O-antigen/teichoic acid export membrane protein